MISQFSFRAVARPWRPPQPLSAPVPPPDPADPLVELLRSLRGREVTVLVGTRQVTGKVILADPVTLVGREGRVTVVAPGGISSVAF